MSEPENEASNRRISIGRWIIIGLLVGAIGVLAFHFLSSPRYPFGVVTSRGDKELVAVNIKPYVSRIDLGERENLVLAAVYEGPDGRKEEVEVESFTYKAESVGTHHVRRQYGEFQAEGVVVVLGRKPARRAWFEPPRAVLAPREKAVFQLWIEYLDGTSEIIEEKEYFSPRELETTVFGYYEELTARAKIRVTKESRKLIGFRLDPWVIRVPKGTTARLKRTAVYQYGDAERTEVALGTKDFLSKTPGTYVVEDAFDGLKASTTVVVLGRKAASRMWMKPASHVVSLDEPAVFEVWVEYLDGTSEKVDEQRFSSSTAMRTSVFSFYENLFAYADVTVGNAVHESPPVLYTAVVPQVERMRLKEAKKLLETLGLVAELSGGDPAPSEKLSYHVQAQTPHAGQVVRAGSSVQIRVFDAYVGQAR